MAALVTGEPAAGPNDAARPREVARRIPATCLGEASALAIVRFWPVPSIRPFRALRYSHEQVEDLSAVVAPPYDVIGPDAHRRLLARDPRNVVRLDLPEELAGDPPDERYRRAARTLSAWRSDGTLHRDPRAALYPYEQTYRIPGTDRSATRRGVFARVVLEPFGAESGIRAHERTLAEPREDRYRLLRATGVNTSPVVGLGEDPTGRVAGWLRDVAGTPPVADIRDEDGVGHRLWMAPVGDDDGHSSMVESICERLGAAPITLADGHHRYETALRYADERRQGPVLEAEPAWAEILMLILEPLEGPLTVLPTHRVLLGLESGAVSSLRSRLPELFEVQEAKRDELEAAFGGAADHAGGEGRLGLWTRDGGAILHAKRGSFAALLPPGGTALRRLDVTLASVAIERLAGIDPAAVAEGRIAFTMSAAEAMTWVDDGHAPTSGLPATAALLLDPTPASEIVAVAADGDVMPQKSTYIYPKALTGLVINPLE